MQRIKLLAIVLIAFGATMNVRAQEPSVPLEPTAYLPEQFLDGIFGSVSLAVYDPTDNTIVLNIPYYEKTTREYTVHVPTLDAGTVVSAKTERRYSHAHGFRRMDKSKTPVNEMLVYRLNGDKLTAKEIVDAFQTQKTVLVSPGTEMLKDRFFRSIFREDLLVIEDPKRDAKIKAMQEITGVTLQSQLKDQ